jgi:hypothetical protein
MAVAWTFPKARKVGSRPEHPVTAEEGEPIYALARLARNGSADESQNERCADQQDSHEPQQGQIAGRLWQLLLRRRGFGRG